MFLKKIASCVRNCGQPHDADLKAMFGTTTVFADWVTENLVSPYGDIISLGLGGYYGAICEGQQIFSVKKGRLIGKRIKLNKAIPKEYYLEIKDEDIRRTVIDTVFHTLETRLSWQSLYESGGV